MNKFFMQAGGIIAASCIVYGIIINSIRLDLAESAIAQEHVSFTKPVMVPYLDIDINDVMRGEKVYVRNQKAVEKDESVSTDTDGFIGEAIVNAGTDDYDDGEQIQSESAVSGDTSSIDPGYSEDSTDVGDTVEVYQEFTAVSDCYESSGNREPVSELVESESELSAEESHDVEYGNGDNGQYETDSGLTYLGDWTITAYCPCAECCGEWATGYTASGNPAISGHTVACNSLPFYSRVIIDGVEYVVEDTGSTDYGDAWIDIFFDTHEEALAYGVQVREVYLVE